MKRKYEFTKKIVISILSLSLVVLTTVATSFAWVGVLSNSRFGEFDISVKSSSLTEYGIEISLDGTEGSFSDSVSTVQLKKKILENCGYSSSSLSTIEKINENFQALNLDQCTTLPNISGGKIVSLSKFTDVYGDDTNKYFKFDLYISATKFYEGSSSDYKLDAYIDDSMLSGEIKEKTLMKTFKYPSDFINPLTPSDTSIIPLKANSEVTKTKVNSASACRVAFEKYEVVEKYKPESYTSASTPVSTIIYSGDEYNYPVYNSETGVYEFGGILPDEYDIATGYYNSFEYKYAYQQTKLLGIPTELYNIRNVESSTADKLITKETNQVIDSTDSNEIITTETMMKVTVYFWFEGWDADCLSAINASPVSLNITFSTSNTMLDD